MNTEAAGISPLRCFFTPFQPLIRMKDFVRIPERTPQNSQRRWCTPTGNMVNMYNYGLETRTRVCYNGLYSSNTVTQRGELQSNRRGVKAT